ncbi:MAG TPA: response regulator, partial [Sandaracinaceae bacterium LLY-WYZ-13_1]|nr:response regulator [Sandaracinaceae bacterium LLY-WYZ-13_1]
PSPPKPAAPKPIAPKPSGGAPAKPAAPAAKTPSPAADAAAAATAPGGDMAAKLGDLGLDADQIQGVLALSREVVERVVWEVVPDLAEVIIREEIRRLTSE